MQSSGYDLVVLGGGIVGLWTARVAARAGARVAVVEVGPKDLSARRDATPPIRFATRANIGSLRARNHVLTGNSSYWGGGLVRNSRQSLDDLYGPELAVAVEAEYPRVEAALGVLDGFDPEATSIRGRPLQEVAVLPGKRRGLWANFDEPRVTCITGSRVTEVRFAAGNTIECVTVRSYDGTEQQLFAPRFALSMGVIDSNLFAQQWLAAAVPERLRGLLGSRLHDHWSVPIGTVTWRGSSMVEPLFPPKFRAGVVAGRRLTIDRGFFHLVADLDRTPPYDRVKAVMRARQQGLGALAVFKASASTMASPFRMLRAGVHYLAHHELHISDGTEVGLVLDFESSNDPANRLVLSGTEAVLHWDLRDGDRFYFERVVRENREWWEALWRDAGLEARWLFDEWSTERIWNYLDQHATDAYHLGGGLHPDTRIAIGLSEVDGTLRGCSNLFVNGTAFYCRPGPANPVLTLLARASVYVQDIAKGASPS